MGTHTASSLFCSNLATNILIHRSLHAVSTFVRKDSKYATAYTNKHTQINTFQIFTETVCFPTRLRPFRFPPRV